MLLLRAAKGRPVTSTGNECIYKSKRYLSIVPRATHFSGSRVYPIHFLPDRGYILLLFFMLLFCPTPQ